MIGKNLGPIGGMALGCLAAWWVAGAVFGDAVRRDVGVGLVGPLVAAVVTWVVVEYTAATRPMRMPRRLLMAFAVKVAFFGAYVALAIEMLQVRPIPFIVSFTASFLACHAIEAFRLHALQTRPASAGRGRA